MTAKPYLKLSPLLAAEVTPGENGPQSMDNKSIQIHTDKVLENLDIRDNDGIQLNQFWCLLHAAASQVMHFPMG